MIAKQEIETLLEIESDILTNDYANELLARLEKEEIEDDIFGFDGPTKKKIMVAIVSGLYRISKTEE